MTLWLVRHALPLIDKGICYGQLDVSSDLVATKACALELAEQLPNRIQVITSPLQRCELLAKDLCWLKPDLVLKTESKLQELNFGEWEGRPWADIPEAELTAWTNDFANHRAGGTGESTTQFMVRVAAAFDALDPAKDTLWVTHAGVIRAATLIAQGVRHIERADQWPVDAPSYGQWCKLKL